MKYKNVGHGLIISCLPLSCLKNFPSVSLVWLLIIMSTLCIIGEKTAHTHRKHSSDNWKNNCVCVRARRLL